MTVHQKGFASYNCGSLFHARYFDFLEDYEFKALSEANLRHLIETCERHFFAARCPRDYARSVAEVLSRRPNADTAGRLEVALAQFSKPVVQEIVLEFNRGAVAPTVAEVFTTGKEIMYWADQSIEPARAELSLRTELATAAQASAN
jgi:hypothetical protein